MLSQVTEDTVYTFALLLAVYLVGSAAAPPAISAGWRGGGRSALTDRLLGPGRRLPAGTAALWAAAGVKAPAVHGIGASLPAAIAAEAVLALVAFGPPTIVMGALFSHLSRRAVPRASASGGRWA